MPDCVNARTSRNVFKLAAQELALLKGSEGDRIYDSPRLGLQFRVVRRHESKKANCTEIMLPQILLQPTTRLQSQFYKVPVGIAHNTSYLAELTRKRFIAFDIAQVGIRGLCLSNCDLS